ncbi:MAG: hypothetical protein CMJ58_18990 [Planctomycetaceae bacterium]|nr:hypothetical protein [Planctomycetaceae bacterium]
MSLFCQQSAAANSNFAAGRLLTGAATLLLGGASLVGCSSGPSAVTPPSIDADDAAAAAMTQYDTDGDGYIAGSELDAAVGLKAAMATLDANQDDKVEESEIANRITSWQVGNTGLTGINCKVTMDGRPLIGARVEFIPEKFLGDEMLAAEGETSPAGMAIVSIPKSKRPDPTWPPGVQYGFYQVKVSMPSGSIPAKYNEETTLGQQVAPDDPAVVSQRMEFALTSK